MTGRLRFPAALAAALITALAAPLHASEFDTGMLGQPKILMPDGDIAANVFLVSDASGWSSEDDALANRLVAKGVAVVGIDEKDYLARLAADQGDCIYMISDIESLSQQIQRKAGNADYKPPILTGRGDGGALVLGMIAQSPVSTIGQAVVVDPVAGIPLKKELCTPATKEVRGERTVYGLTPGELPAPVTALFTPSAPADGKAHVDALVAEHADIVSGTAAGNAAEALGAALDDIVTAEAGDQPLGLPLSILPVKPEFDTMAVIYSGDGGWRDIDKEVGTELQKRGIPVVGVDSLRYFWSERTPEETTADLKRIIDLYRQQWHVRHVLLIGYSFGADILPAAYNGLPPADQALVKQISLMALSNQVDYEVSVTGWLGMASDARKSPVEDIARIDPGLLQCIYGTEEDDDPCPTLKANGIDTVPIVGGHHFDEDYPKLAGLVIDRLRAKIGR